MIGEHTLAVENATAVLKCIQSDGLRVVRRVVEVSEAGRASKNDPALFVLAMAASLGDQVTRRAAFEALPRVARIGTHLFHFVAFAEQFRGWGRGLRQGVAGWYNAQPADKLAYQVIKYQQRDRWSNRDLLRLAHPTAPTDAHQQLYRWITQAELPEQVADELALIEAFVAVQTATSEADVARLIREHRLPREAVPTEWLQSAAVWETLLEGMPMTALIRNLATLTRVGLLQPMSAWTQHVTEQIGNVERLRRARVHPLAVLAALTTYASGRGARGRNEWEPVQQITDALDGAFYLSFGNVTPVDKRIVLALDVSGSMTVGAVAGIPGLTPRVASAAIALVTAATETKWTATAFSKAMVPLSISPRQRLDDVVQTVSSLPFGGTDCALPMLWALENRVEADLFAIYTDSETWAGQIHPVQALQRYREQTGISAKLVVIGMVSNGFTIADPDDAGMLDVVGFDSATPEVISSFARGTLGA